MILVCDDDPPVRTFLARLFQRAGFTVDTAIDGVEALEKIARNDYAILILDLMMPRVNGYDVVAELKKRSQRPLVIVLTANPKPEITELDAEIVQAVIKKPFDLDMLTLIVNGLAAAKFGTGPAIAPSDRPEDRI